MPRKPISFELDFMIKDIFPRFTVKQFDDVSFNIKPLNQGLEYDTSNMIGKIYVGVNNDMFMQTTDITVSSDNINVLLDKNMLQKNGRAYAEIELTDEDGTITSSSFIFDIDPKIGEGGMIPGEYEGFVEKYERLISEFKAQINSSISNSNDLVDKTIKNCNTSIDNKLNTVDDRLNRKIREVNEKLDTVDTRFNSKASEVDSKLKSVDGIVNTKITNVNNTLNIKVTEVDNKLNTVDGLITAKVSDFEKRFNRLTSSQQQNSEVIDAREGEVSLKARLDKDIENPKKLYASIEGTEISVDSLEGYLKDIEILGNTVQDQDNLADIRSVGDKLENQELYEIPVLIRGKNLFDGELEYGTFNWDTGEVSPSTSVIRSKNFICVIGGMDLILSSSNDARDIQYIFEYNKDKKFIRYITSTKSVKLSDEAKYIKIRSQGNNLGGYTLPTTFPSIQLEEGTVTTPYEPYQEYKLTILSPVQLEKVRDVADRIIYKDGVWGVEKNIGVYTFNTSLLNLTHSPNNTNIQYYAENVLPNALRDASSVNNINNFCPSIKMDDRKSCATISCWNSTSIAFAMPKDMYPTLTDFKNSIPKEIEVRYILAEPQFMPLPNSQQIKLRTFVGKTNIHFGCEIEPTLKASVPKSLGASVSSNTTQIDNLSKELQKINNLEETVTSEVVTESDFITVENTSNGYFEDVKLEGKTLVNLVNYYSKTLEATIWNYFIKTSNLNCTLKHNTEYTMIAYVQGLSANKGITLNSNNSYGLFNNTTIYIDGNGTWVSKVTTKADFTGMTDIIFTAHNPSDNVGTYTLSLCLLEGDHTQNPPSYFEGLKSVGQDVDEISVLSTNKEETKQDKKRILYYNDETDTWEKPILREWDSIEKHSDGKYYYHKRSGEVVLNGSEHWEIYNVHDNEINTCAFSTNIKANNCISDMFNFKILYNTDDESIWIRSTKNISIRILKTKLTTQNVDGFKQYLQANNVTVVYQLEEEKVYECTNIDLITYSGETNLLVKSGVLNPKVTLKVKKGIGNVVTMLQNKVAMLEDLVNKLIQK